MEDNMKEKINGLAVNISGNEKSKPIVFIHGFPYDSTMWKDTTKALKNEFKCITYDVRGLGKSKIGDGIYTMESYVDDLYNLIKKLKLKKPVICGLSMGGYMALRFAEKYKEDYSALILMDTKADGDDNTNKLKRAGIIEKINNGKSNKFVEEFVTNCFSVDAPKDYPKLLKATIKQSKKNSPKGIKGATIALLSRTDTNDFLKEISVPTLLICGAFDKLTPPKVMREMGEKIPNSEIAIVPRSGHMTPIENPAAVNDLILGFLRRLSVQ